MLPDYFVNPQELVRKTPLAYPGEQWAASIIGNADRLAMAAAIVATAVVAATALVAAAAVAT
jgi:hypothetical protein